uniref:Uncharacterized protein n=1 Tax=mine drainage metagenome TaxID=410659 RepID=E6QWA9_9ZZZZ
MNSTSVALRAKQAAKIAHQKLTEFTLESSLMRDLIHSWLTKLSAGDRGVLAADHTIIARKKFGFFNNCTVNFSSMLENSASQPHQRHHERHCPLRTSSWTENALVGEVC